MVLHAVTIFCCCTLRLFSVHIQPPADFDDSNLLTSAFSSLLMILIALTSFYFQLEPHFYSYFVRVFDTCYLVQMTLVEILANETKFL